MSEAHEIAAAEVKHGGLLTMAAIEERITALPVPELYELLDFANRVQRWSFRGASRRKGYLYGTFGQAAQKFNVPVERIAEAVAAHYWMFSLDDDLPLAERRIDHEGE